ncbi:Rv3235 family protein [Streptomyces tendae]
MRKVMTRTQLRPTPTGPLTPALPYGPGDTPPGAPGGPRRAADGGSVPPPGFPSLGATSDYTPSGDTAPRAPGGVPPRRPGARGARAAASGGRPPGTPGRSQRSRTRPADTRPPTAGPGRGPRPGPLTDPSASGLGLRGGTAGPATASPPVPAGPATGPVVGRTAPEGHRPVARPSTAPVVPAQTPRRPIPQLRPTDHFAELLLGVLSGRRPVHSMLRHTLGRAYDDLADLAERGPLRTRGAAAVVRDIGYFEPRPGALEVFARIGAGDRLRAMAFRLEQGRDLRWRCTAVELGGPRRPRTDDD